MRYWWVSQNQTYKHEIDGGFMWSPKKDKNGNHVEFYENMRRINPGDIIFSFCDTLIKAVGIASARAITARKPNFGTAGEEWSDDGWLVTVDYTEFDNPIRPKDIIEKLAPHLPEKYSPIRKDGGGNQIYLAHIPEGFAQVLMQEIGGEYEAAIDGLLTDADFDTNEDRHERDIDSRSDIDTTEKEALIRARRGQGKFRRNVAAIEERCRITGVSDATLLIASHIKPWRDSSDAEKLDGDNGLLLAPHVDRLFDRGLISFGDNGQLLVSDALEPSVLEAWGIPVILNVGVFSTRQSRYLGFHRENIFQSDVPL